MTTAVPRSVDSATVGMVRTVQTPLTRCQLPEGQMDPDETLRGCEQISIADNSKYGEFSPWGMCPAGVASGDVHDLSPAKRPDLQNVAAIVAIFACGAR